MERQTALASLCLLVLAGCYSEKPPATNLDLSEVPESVAILIPIEGVADFAVQPVGSVTDFPLHITNVGPFPASSFQLASSNTLAAPFGFKGGSFPGTGGTCTATVAPSEVCTLVLSFNPTQYGTFEGELWLEYMNGVIVAPLKVSTTGLTSVTLAADGGALTDFGTTAKDSTVERTITIVNDGNLDATSITPVALAAPFAFKGGSYPGTGGNCGAVLEKSSSCQVVLRFTPGAHGSFTGTLTLAYQSSGTPQSFQQTLKGATPAFLTFADSPSYDFKRHAKGTQTDRLLTVNNAGGAAATGLGEGLPVLALPFEFAGGGVYPGNGANCGTTLAAGASCTLKVRFRPSALGDVSQALKLAYNDGLAAATSSLTLSGRGQSGWDSSLAPAPAQRMLHSSVWTGSQLIVWGGQRDDGVRYGDGYRYDPTADTWTPITAVNAPAPRSRHTAIWAANASPPVMIVFGGVGAGGSALDTGGLYDPATNQWTPINTLGAPSPRFGHTAVWDDVRKRMIVWGGADAGVSATGLGYLFDPSAGGGGSWTQLADGLPDTPAARYQHDAVWTGTQMLVWGGCLLKNAGLSCDPGSETNTGAAYDPAGGHWTPIDPTGAPSGRFQHRMAWTGKALVVFGGATDSFGNGATITPTDTGAYYEPTTPGTLAPGTWTALDPAGAPSARREHLTLWNGSKLAVFGGLEGGAASGALWDETSGTWNPMAAAGAPTDTFGASGVYTGATDRRILVFGGKGAGAVYSNQLRIYAPE